MVNDRITLNGKRVKDVMALNKNWSVVSFTPCVSTGQTFNQSNDL